MRKLLPVSLVAVFIVAVVIMGNHAGQAQAPAQAQTTAPATQPGVTPRAEIYKGAGLADVSDAFLRWPIPPGSERYGAIDGKRMHRYVVEQAAIARRYRDQGHPKFWGRIIGTRSDAESAEWLAAKFKRAGLADVRIQPFDLAPQWMPQAWDVTVTSGGKTVRIGSAQPAYRAQRDASRSGWTSRRCMSGSGARRTSSGKDVKGKAVFVLQHARHAGRRARCGGRTPKAPPRSSKWTCCPATCAIRPTRRARTRRPSSSGVTMALRCAT